MRTRNEWPWQYYQGAGELPLSPRHLLVAAVARARGRLYVELSTLVRADDGRAERPVWKPGTQRLVLPMDQLDALSDLLAELTTVELPREPGGG